MPVSPPRPKGPPLNALRAFEAAARLESFKAAAEELSVTAGAVAQQVKSLEAWAGARLFERRAQGVRLTALGRAVAPALKDAFDRLAGAANAIRERAAPHEVRVAALPSVAQLWLSPRLPAIRRANPGLAISVTATEHPPNLLREPFDIAVFFGAGAREGTRVTVLAEDFILPVCAPEIAARLTGPAGLAGETLLHDSAWRDDWSTWLRAAGADEEPAAAGPVFSLYSLAVGEAVHGAGVLAGHLPLVAPLLAAGSLVALFGLRVPTGRPLTARLRRDASPDSLAARLLAELLVPVPGLGPGAAAVSPRPGSARPGTPAAR